MGLTATYDALEVTSDGLDAFLARLGPEWVGLSLTMPLKQTVLPLLDELTRVARATGAVNTVLLGDGVRRGDNTDVAGMVAALAERGVGSCRSGVVLGGGATAASALAALAELGERSPTVLVRDVSRTGPLREAAARLGAEPRVRAMTTANEEDDAAAELMAADVVISTVPAGGLSGLSGAGVLLDVAYDPWPTPLAAGWGGPVVGGAVMLLHQAAVQVQLMTGRPAPLQAMRAALPSVLLG